MQDDVQTLTDIAYGPLPAHKLDVHAPAAARARPQDALFPLVVFVHGGAWRS